MEVRGSSSNICTSWCHDYLLCAIGRCRKSDNIAKEDRAEVETGKDVSKNETKDSASDKNHRILVQREIFI